MKKELLLSLIVFLLSFCVADLIMRLFLPPVYPLNNKYGWSVPENSTGINMVYDHNGSLRKVTNAYFNHGFKRWGNINTSKTKIFIIGDSFTQMQYVANGEEYYSYLEEEFDNVELFVYGAAGYGSVQEYMILDDFIDVINPDLILIQYDPSDYVNNIYKYDLESYPYNSFQFRPYLENSRIVYKLPMPFARLRKLSRILDYSLNIYDDIARDRAVNDAEGTDIFYSGLQNRILSDSEAFNSTKEVVSAIQKRAKPVPVYMFSTYNFTRQERLICSEVNITCIFGVAEYIQKKENEGIQVNVVNNPHWNLAGNKLVGEFLINFFKENRILKN